jgi:hypothetical protein
MAWTCLARFGRTHCCRQHLINLPSAIPVLLMLEGLLYLQSCLPLGLLGKFLSHPLFYLACRDEKNQACRRKIRRKKKRKDLREEGGRK